jgi:capsular polysaccharide biosynthesis protein
MRRSHLLWRAVRPVSLAWQRIRGRSVWKGGPPHGVFSEADAIRRGDVEGGVLPSEPHASALPPTSEVIAAGLGQERYGNWNCVWSVRENAMLVSPGLPHLDPAGRACLEAMHGPHHLTDPVFRRRTSQSSLLRMDGYATSILSRWNDGGSYYHWFLDGLTRLVHLDRFPEDTVIIVPAHLAGFARQSLELLHLKHRVRPAPEGDCEIERYAFAGPTMLSGCPDPRGVSWLRRRFMAQKTGPATLNLYLERKADRRTCHNAAAVAKVFTDKGWEVVDPGSMDLETQIRLFGRARRVAGLHGAALTNLLWMPGGTSVLEIMPSRRRNGCYAGIAHCAGIDHQAWVLPSDRLGNLEIPLDALRRRLDEWQG